MMRKEYQLRSKVSLLQPQIFLMMIASCIVMLFPSNSIAEKMELICNLDDTSGAKTNWNIRDHISKQEMYKLPFYFYLFLIDLLQLIL